MTPGAWLWGLLLVYGAGMVPVAVLCTPRTAGRYGLGGVLYLLCLVGYVCGAAWEP